jgi:hypothetical protein
MLSSGILCHVALVRNVLEGRRSVMRVTRTGELGAMLAVVTANVVPSLLILDTLIMEAIHSSEMLVLARATQHNISEVSILHSHCHEILRSCITLPFAHRFSHLYDKN